MPAAAPDRGASGPRVVVSLDFELRWGVADRLRDFSQYRVNLEGVREAVPALLELFTRLGVTATWATVGAIACESWDEIVELAPPSPRYADPRLAHDIPAYRAADPTGRLHFAPDLVARVAQTPGQEVGSHTFLHTFFREPGVMRRDVHADCVAVREVFTRRLERAPESFVFPRNQIAFADMLPAYGIRTYRDNASTWYWRRTREAEESSLIRGLRLMESLLPVGRRVAPGRESRASYFMRVGLPEKLFQLHRRRVAADATQMGEGDVLHLWAHPHNFGADLKRTTRRLEELLTSVRERRPDVSFAPMRAFAA